LTFITASSRTQLVLVVVVLGLVAPFLPSWLLFLLTVSFAKGLVVLGVVLLLRGDLVSFGHGVYYAGGAYAIGIALRNGLAVHEAVVLVGLGLIVTTALACILGLFIARYRGIFFGMLSTAFTMIAYSLLVKLRWLSGGTDGIAVHATTFAGFETSGDTVRLIEYYFVLVLAAGAVFGAYRVAASPLGYLMRAISDNEVRVEFMGASVRRAIYGTYVLSGALAGLGGALTAVIIGHISPDMAYWTISGEFVFVALFGGIGSVFAPMFGSVVFEFVRNYAFKISPYTWQILLGGVLLIIILYAPGGLWSIFEQVAARWTRRLAPLPTKPGNIRAASLERP
jgi:ABC-type branched-subunit amino acid transport system permease subunit